MKDTKTEGKKQSWVKSKIARVGMSLTALGGLGGGAYVADQQGLIDIPGIRQNVENNLPVYPTFTEIIDQVALYHALGKDGTPLDQLPTTSFVTTKTIFRADTNGVPVSPEELSTLLQGTVKPYNEETQTSNILFLFPIKGPVNQNIIVEDISILIRFAGLDDTRYELIIHTKGNVQSLSSDSILPALQDAPEIGKDDFYAIFDPNYQNIKGKPLSVGTSVLKTINDNAGLSFRLYANKEGMISHFDFLQKQQKNIYIP